MGKGKGATRTLARRAALEGWARYPGHRVTHEHPCRALTGQSIPSFELHAYLSKKEYVPPAP